MSIGRALAILGAGATGYGAGQDQKRKQQREDDDAAWQAKQRARTETQWQRDDEEYQRRKAEEAAVESAAKPVASSPVYPTNDDEGNAMPTTPDMQRFTVPGQPGVMTEGAATAAVGAANAPAARMRRAAGAMRDPVRAASTEAAAGQAELGQMQLATARWEQDVGRAMVSGGWEGITRLMSESAADGQGGKAKFGRQVSPDGKKVTVFQIGQDGAPAGVVDTFDNSQEGLATLAFLLKSRTKPEAMVEHFRRVKKDTADAEDKGADNKRLDAAQAEVARHNKAMEGIGMAGVAARGAGGAGGATQPAPVWDDKADAFLRERYTIKDPVSGAVSVDGAGMQFGKLLALGMAQRNGGDATTALGFAFERDNQLRAAATDPKGNYDATKHNALRNQYLQALTTPQGAAPTAAPAAPGAAPAPKPAQKPAQQADPVAVIEAGLSRRPAASMSSVALPTSDKFKTMPEAELKKYNKNHPDYEAAQAELRTRRDAAYGNGVSNTKRFNG